MEDYIDEYRQNLIGWEEFCRAAKQDIERAKLKKLITRPPTPITPTNTNG